MMNLWTRIKSDIYQEKLIELDSLDLNEWMSKHFKQLTLQEYYNLNNLKEDKEQFKSLYLDLLQNKEEDLKFEVIVELIEEKCFPIETFSEWYLENQNLPPLQFAEALGEFWGDVWKNAARGGIYGAAGGAAAGGLPGAAIGGLAGATAGGLYGTGKGLLRKAWNWGKGQNDDSEQQQQQQTVITRMQRRRKKNDFESTKAQALELLKHLKEKSKGMNLSNNFHYFLDSLINELGVTKAFGPNKQVYPTPEENIPINKPNTEVPLTPPNATTPPSTPQVKPISTKEDIINIVKSNDKEGLNRLGYALGTLKLNQTNADNPAELDKVTPEEVIKVYNKLSGHMGMQNDTESSNFAYVANKYVQHLNKPPSTEVKSVDDLIEIINRAHREKKGNNSVYKLGHILSAFFGLHKDNVDDIKELDSVDPNDVIEHYNKSDPFDTAVHNDTHTYEFVQIADKYVEYLKKKKLSNQQPETGTMPEAGNQVSTPPEIIKALIDYPKGRLLHYLKIHNLDHFIDDEWHIGNEGSTNRKRFINHLAKELTREGEILQ